MLYESTFVNKRVWKYISSSVYRVETGDSVFVFRQSLKTPFEDKKQQQKKVMTVEEKKGGRRKKDDPRTSVEDLRVVGRTSVLLLSVYDTCCFGLFYLLRYHNLLLVPVDVVGTCRGRQWRPEETHLSLSGEVK